MRRECRQHRPVDEVDARGKKVATRATITMDRSATGATIGRQQINEDSTRLGRKFDALEFVEDDCQERGATIGWSTSRGGPNAQGCSPLAIVVAPRSGRMALWTRDAMTPLNQLTDDQLRACVVSSDYPLIQCSHPGVSLPGYIICVHAIADASEMVIEHASSTKVGRATCFQCVQSRRLAELRTACAHYFRDHYAVPL